MLTELLTAISQYESKHGRYPKRVQLSNKLYQWQGSKLSYMDIEIIEAGGTCRMPSL